MFSLSSLQMSLKVQLAIMILFPSTIKLRKRESLLVCVVTGFLVSLLHQTLVMMDFIFGVLIFPLVSFMIVIPTSISIVYLDQHLS